MAQISLRLDEDDARLLDELTAHYGKGTAGLGITFNRSDCLRLVLRDAHQRMLDTRAAA